MKLLALLLGVLFGAAELWLTKATVDRAMSGKALVIWITAKVVSYSAVLLPVFLLLPRTFAIWFGVGVGAGLPVCALALFAWRSIRKRGD